MTESGPKAPACRNGPIAPNFRPWRSGIFAKMPAASEQQVLLDQTPEARLVKAPLAAALLAGSASPISEFAFRVRDARWLPYESGGWSLGVDRSDGDLRIYLASGETSWPLKQLLRDAEDPAFDRGEPLIRSDCDVYRKGERLIYTTDSCSRMDEGFGFFAHAHPSSPGRFAALEPEFERLPMETLPEHVWKGEALP